MADFQSVHRRDTVSDSEASIDSKSISKRQILQQRPPLPPAFEQPALLQLEHLHAL